MTIDLNEPGLQFDIEDHDFTAKSLVDNAIRQVIDNELGWEDFPSAEIQRLINRVLGGKKDCLSNERIIEYDADIEKMEVELRNCKNTGATKQVEYSNQDRKDQLVCLTDEIRSIEKRIAKQERLRKPVVDWIPKNNISIELQEIVLGRITLEIDRIEADLMSAKDEKRDVADIKDLTLDKTEKIERLTDSIEGVIQNKAEYIKRCANVFEFLTDVLPELDSL